jgi:hypothetical protein
MSKKRRSGQRKHIPMRTCIVCRQSLPKRSLIRIVASPEQGIVADPTGKLAGRGAYVCHDSVCWAELLAGSNSLLSKALRAPVSDDDRARLQSFWEQQDHSDH